MGNIKEESLSAALRASGCVNLPPEFKDGDAYWVKAIALVEKTGGQECYALVEHGADGTVRIVKDCSGTLTPIKTGGDKQPVMLKTYAYKSIDPKFLDYKDRKTAEVRLRTYFEHRPGVKAAIEAASDEQILVWMRERAIFLQQAIDDRDEATLLLFGPDGNMSVKMASPSDAGSVTDAGVATVAGSAADADADGSPAAAKKTRGRKSKKTEQS